MLPEAFATAADGFRNGQGWSTSTALNGNRVDNSAAG
jgi:hypothetical protein